MQKLDPRLNAFRSDRADKRLQDKVESRCFVSGALQRVKVPTAILYKIPDNRSERQSECLFGENVLVFEETDKFCWVQAQQDNYVGYMERSKLAPIETTLTHWVTVPRTFQYFAADLRSPMVTPLSMGSCLTVVGQEETRGTLYAELDNGHFVVTKHIAPINTLAQDYVSVAESFIHTPYLWGGKSGMGIDCSGLVSLSMMMAGKSVLRDTDMQQASIGIQIDPINGLQRGDLVFWKGHVAIMVNENTILHANGASMDVKKEPLNIAIERIARLYSTPTCFKRP